MGASSHSMLLRDFFSVSAFLYQIFVCVSACASFLPVLGLDLNAMLMLLVRLFLLVLCLEG